MMRRFDNNFLPSDEVLAATYGATRSIIRRALGMLGDQGIIERRQGLGTFVRSPQLQFALNAPMTEEQFLSPDLGVSRVQVTAVETLDLPAAVASALGSDESTCTCIDYLQFVHGLVTTVGTSYLLATPSTELRPGLYLGGFAALLRSTGIETAGNDVMIQAVNADEATAETLDVSTGHALIYTRRIAYDPAGTPIELTYTRHRSELTSFVVRRETAETAR